MAGRAVWKGVVRFGPDTEPESYFALPAALKDTRKEGLASWRMRRKSYYGALRIGEDGFLRIIALRHAGEAVKASDLPRLEGRSLETQEIHMAEQLVRALEGDFNPAAGLFRGLVFSACVNR